MIKFNDFYFVATYNAKWFDQLIPLVAKAYSLTKKLWERKET